MANRLSPQDMLKGISYPFTTLYFFLSPLSISIFSSFPLLFLFLFDLFVFFFFFGDMNSSISISFKTVEDSYTKQETVGNRSVSVEILDTAGTVFKISYILFAVCSYFSIYC